MAVNYTDVQKIEKYISRTNFDALEMAAVPEGTEFNIVDQIHESDLDSDILQKLNNNAKINTANTFTAAQTFKKDITIEGNIIQNGSAYETHAEKLYTKNDMIYTRDGATAALADNAYTGIQAVKYDGTNDGQLVFGKDGVARVGDVGNTQPLATRAEKNLLTDKHLVQWDAAGQTLVDSNRTVDEFAILGSDNNFTGENRFAQEVQVQSDTAGVSVVSSEGNAFAGLLKDRCRVWDASNPTNIISSILRTESLQFRAGSTTTKYYLNKITYNKKDLLFPETEAGGTFALTSDIPTDYLTGGSQTTTSSADGGSNVFTFTKANGTSATFTVKNGSKGSKGDDGSNGIRGSRWSTGTAITGTSTTAAVFSGTGIADALINDMYLNTSTGYIYKCTAAGTASVAKWVYEGSIKGPTPSTSDFASLTGSNTFTGYNTFKYPVYIQSTVEANSVEMLKYISNSGSSEALYLPKNTTGTLALTKDIPTIEANPTDSGTIALTKLKVGSTTYNIPSSGSGDVTAAGNNTFTGNNTFEGTVKVLGNNLYAKTLRVYWENEAQTKRNTLQLVPRNEDNGTEYSQFAIEDVDITAGTKKVLAINHGMIKQLNFTGVTTTSNGTLASSYNLTLPQKAGTLALTEDIPSTEDFASLTGNNVFTGTNTFNGTVNIKAAAVSMNSTLGSLLLNSAANVTVQNDTIFDNKQSFAGSGIRYDKASNPGTDDWNETRVKSSTTGHQSLAFGGSVHTYADWGVAFGADTRAYMKCSTVSGKGNQAGPRDSEKTTYTISNTFGNAGNPARSQKLTHTWNYGEYADARASGVLNKALGFASDAGNGENIAFGHYSTAKGYQNVAGGDHSTVIGSNNLASGKLSFAGGNGSIASGEGAVTFGRGTRATATYATALGEGTIANTANSMVVGGYNDSSVNNALFVVGNGTASQRNNAFVVHGDGRATVFTSPIYSNDVVRLGDLPISSATLSDNNTTLTLVLR